MKTIYLDYAATTPLDARVLASMQAHLADQLSFGNPSSLHVYGQKAREIIEEAREVAATLIGALPSEIIWTSGATESNNLALKGGAHLYQNRGKHIITMRSEHKAILDVCQHLEKEGFSVTYLNPKSNGLLDIDELKAAIQADTILISIMHVNNETGVIQDIESIAHLTYEKGILFHVDASQSIGKIPLDLSKIPIDLLSFTAHKFYGPKGIGVLFLRKKPRVRVEPLFHGGGQEQGMRSGTLPVHQIVGMGQASKVAIEDRKNDEKHTWRLRHYLLEGIKIINDENPGSIVFNTHLEQAAPFILNMRFEGMIANALLQSWPGFALSTTSACQNTQAGSHVLRAMGLSNEQVKSSLRVSWGRMTQSTEIEMFLNEIVQLFGGKKAIPSFIGA